MILSEAGYSQKDHDAGVAAIAAQNLNITEIIHQLVDLYTKLYKVDAYHINCGMCEDFANDVCDLVGENCYAGWGDYYIDENDDEYQYAYHCIIQYKGKFYDSEHPEGVEDFRMISAFHSKGEDYEVR